jgi:hypothetical protein
MFLIDSPAAPRGQRRPRKPAGEASLAERRELDRADRIRQFWIQRGFRIEVRIEEITVRGMTFACARSDLVGSLPRGHRR